MVFQCSGRVFCLFSKYLWSCGDQGGSLAEKVTPSLCALRAQKSWAALFFFRLASQLTLSGKFLIILLVANWNTRPTFPVFQEFASVHRLMKLVGPLLKPPVSQGKYHGKVLFVLLVCLFFTSLIYTLARGKKLSCLHTAPWGAIQERRFVPLKLWICFSVPLPTKWKGTFSRVLPSVFVHPHGVYLWMAHAHGWSRHRVTSAGVRVEQGRLYRIKTLWWPS